MIQLTQRQINYGVFGILTICASLITITLLISGQDVNGIYINIGIVLVSAGLWAAYWRGWEYAKHILVILISLAVALGQDTSLITSFSPGVLIPVVLALVLTSPLWVFASGIMIFSILFFRSDVGGIYTQPLILVLVGTIITGLIFSRLAIDNAQRLEVAKRAADEARMQAEHERARAEQQSQELAQRSEEQRRLLELVAALETPTITVAEGVLLAPIVGTLDARRATVLITRLLKDASAQRTKLVIIDIAGVATMDAQVIQGILQSTQALRLLGCQVTITGVSPTMATTMTRLGMLLNDVKIARSPQDVLHSTQLFGLTG